MKDVLKGLLGLILLCLVQVAWAQPDNDCDCDYEGAFDPVCIETPFGLTLEIPECLAICEGLDFFECEDDGNDEIDCDCDYEGAYDLVCVETDFGVIELPECLAACEGLAIVDCGDDDNDDEDDEMDCDCDYEGAFDLVCAAGEWQDEIMILPECIAICEGFDIIDCDWDDEEDDEEDDDEEDDDEDWDWDWDWENDCDCNPMEDDVIVCVVDEFGFVFSLPECLALCWEMEIVDADCDEWDWEDENDGDCDCPEDEEPGIYCVMEPWGDEIFIMEGTVCFIEECLGCIIVDCEDYEDDEEEDDGDDEWDWEYDCDCDPMEDNELVCVVDEYGFVFSLPECLALCWEMEIVDGDCDEWDWDDEWDDEDEDWEWDYDCDCDPEEDDVIVCAVDEEGNMWGLPECLAICWELEIVDGDCTEDWEEDDYDDCPYDWDWDWDFDCDCDPFEDDLIVCVEDDYGYTYGLPECLAVCLELNIVDGDCSEDWDWDDGDDDWEYDCDCDPFEDDVIVCAEDEEGNVWGLPECLALCWELTIIDGDCSDDWDWDWEDEDDDEDDDEWDDDWYDWDCDCNPFEDDVVVCVEDLEGNVFALPECLALCWELTIVDGDCDEWDDDWDWEDEDEDDDDEDDDDDEFNEEDWNTLFTLNGDNGVGGKGSISVVAVFPNPTNGDARLAFESTKDGLVYIKIMNMTGQVAQYFEYSAIEGYQQFDFSLESLESGVYFITIGSSEEVPASLRVVKQ